MKSRNHDKIWTVGSIGHVGKDCHFADWKVKGTGFPNLSNSRYAKSRNDEMRNCETPFGAAYGHHWWSREGKKLVELNFFRVLGIATWSVETLHHRTGKMMKYRNAKTPFGVVFGYRELECRKTSSQEC